MKNIIEIDKNFARESAEGYSFNIFNIRQQPFEVNGLMYSEEKKEYHRMPYAVADQTNEGVAVLQRNTSGGRVRFRTDSQKILVRCSTGTKVVMEHMTHACSMGFSLYADNVFQNIIVPPVNEGWEAKALAKKPYDFGFETIVKFNVKREREITVYFPLYNGVKELFIGLEENASLNKPSKFLLDKPVLVYGNSITQGACCSRPGNSYDAILCRRLNLDYINLGFSGSGKAEPAMVEYLSKIPCSLLLLDYDDNAPTLEYLKKTHFNLYKKFREKQPDTPIVMFPRTYVSREYVPSDDLNGHLRAKIVRKTFDRAIRLGDKNIYYIEGESFYDFKGIERDSCTVDGCHPNDLGFMLIANKLYPIIKKALGLDK